MKSNTDTELREQIADINRRHEFNSPRHISALADLIARRDSEKWEALLKAVGEEEATVEDGYIDAGAIARNGIRFELRQALESIHRGTL